MNISDIRKKMFVKIDALEISDIGKVRKKNTAVKFCRLLANLKVVVSNSTHNSKPALQVDLASKHVRLITSLARRLKGIAEVENNSLFV